MYPNQGTLPSRAARRARRAPFQHRLFLLLYALGALALILPGHLVRPSLPEFARRFVPDLERLVPDVPGAIHGMARRVRDPYRKLGSCAHFFPGPDATPANPPSAGAPAPPPYLSFGEQGLSRFRIKLVQLEKGLRRRVRVVHFGDSMLWYENTARRLRANLQKRYGDGGRGFVYLHGQDFGISLDGHENASKGFELLAIPYNHFNHAQPKWLPEVGFLGLTYRAFPGARSTQWSTLPQAAPWTSATAVVRPGPGQSGRQALLVQGPEATGLLGRGEVLLPGSGCVALEAGFPPSRRISVDIPVVGAADRSAYIDALLLETERGVSYSSVILKGRHMAWLTAVPETNFDCGLRAMRPDLVVMQFGINESASIDWRAYGFTEQDYVRQATELFSRIRRALPDVDVLLIGPYERLKPGAGGVWTQYQAHDRVRELQKQMARAQGLAFFDSWSFLGGEGQLRRLIPKRLAHNDYAHLTMEGGDLLADAVFRELVGDSQNVPVDSGFGGAVRKEEVATASESPILFNSRAFLWFFLFVLVAATALSRLPSARLVLLTVASWFFYASWNWWVIFLILGSTVLDYFAALAVDYSRCAGRRGTLWLCSSLVGNLGLLFFFKYHDFFAGLFNPVVPEPWRLPILNLLLPVGISFYTFQTLSYTIDVWRGVLPVERSFLRFSLFVAFFPQLVAGPIVRAAQFLPDITSRIRHFVLTRTRAAEALFLISSGLLKKALADTLATNLVDRVFQTPRMYTVTETLAGIYGFAVQIYLDFSSYTDIALGCAALLGFHLTENFRRPYAAVTVSDFWRRWHISLGSWLRDYLYMSLGGNRSRVLVNLGITMLLAGLWHGAGVNFVLWGAFHGALLVVERALGLHRLRAEELSALGRFAMRLLVFHLVLVGWVLFRCQDLRILPELGHALATRIFVAPNLDLATTAAIALPLAWHWLPAKATAGLVARVQRMPALLQGAVGASLAMLATGISSTEARAFLYFQF